MKTLLGIVGSLRGLTAGSDNQVIQVLLGLLLFPTLAFGAQPDGTNLTLDSRKVTHGLHVVTIHRVTAFNSTGLDTIYVYAGNFKMGQTGAANAAGTEIAMFFDNLASGDSLSVTMVPVADISKTVSLYPTTAGIAAFTVVGGAAATVTFEKTVLSPPANFWRFIIDNTEHSSMPSIDYKLLIYLEPVN